MADDTHRQVAIERIESQKYTVTNERGGQMTIGTGEDPDFTPVELLLAAIGGCLSVDVDVVTSRRAEPESFVVEAAGEKIQDGEGSRLTDISLTFRVRFPDGEDGDKARAILPNLVKRHCTVSRTVAHGTPITSRAE
jgi:putative redox protein